MGNGRERSVPFVFVFSFNYFYCWKLKVGERVEMGQWGELEGAKGKGK